jgi:hypothetical protein
MRGKRKSSKTGSGRRAALCRPCRLLQEVEGGDGRVGLEIRPRPDVLQGVARSRNLPLQLNVQQRRGHGMEEAHPHLDPRRAVDAQQAFGVAE